MESKGKHKKKKKKKRKTKRREITTKQKEEKKEGKKEEKKIKKRRKKKKKKKKQKKEAKKRRKKRSKKKKKEKNKKKKTLPCPRVISKFFNHLIILAVRSAKSSNNYWKIVMMSECYSASVRPMGKWRQICINTIVPINVRRL